MDFPFTNSTSNIPLWARANLTRTSEFDLEAAKRIAGVKPPFPVLWIVVISLGIASAFSIVFLAIFCYIRRHRVQTWLQRRRQRTSVAYAQIERKEVAKKKQHRPGRKVRPGSDQVLDLDSQSGRSDSDLRRGEYLAVGTAEDPFSARPIPMAHQRDPSSSSINLLPGLPLDGPSGSINPLSTTSSGNGNYPSKVYAGGSGGGGVDAYGARARAEAADNAMKRADASRTVNMVSGAPPPGQTTTQSSFGTVTTGSLGRNALYQDAPPVPPAPASYGSSTTSRSHGYNAHESPVQPYGLLQPMSPPADRSALPRDSKRKQQHQQQAASYSHSANGSTSSLHTFPAAAPSSGIGGFNGHRSQGSSSTIGNNHRATPSSRSVNLPYEQGPSQPRFTRTKQVSSTRRDEDFDIDGSPAHGSGRVRTHSRASSFDMVSPPTSPPAILVQHPSPAVGSPRTGFPAVAGEPFFSTPPALDPARRALAVEASSSAGATRFNSDGTTSRTPGMSDTGTFIRSDISDALLPHFTFREPGDRESAYGSTAGGTLVSMRVGHADRYDALGMSDLGEEDEDVLDTDGRLARRMASTDVASVAPTLPSVYQWAEQQIRLHPPDADVQSEYSQRTGVPSESMYSQDASRGVSPMPPPPIPSGSGSRSHSPAHLPQQPSRAYSPQPPYRSYSPQPPPAARSYSPYHSPSPSQDRPQLPPQPVDRDPFATLRELAVASPGTETEPGSADQRQSQPWGFTPLGHGRNQSSGAPGRDRFADDYPSSSSGRR